MIFASVFAVLPGAELASAVRPFIYWAVVVATTMVGTTKADLADRSMSLATLAHGPVRRFDRRDSDPSHRVEAHYWITKLFT